VAAFLLACSQVFDPDIWWHLRGGQWILQNHRAPDLDPFIFGSADRVWIDLSWLFQVLMAFLYDHGGIPALVLACAAVGTAAVAIAASVRSRRWFIPLALIFWIPAFVLMSSRFRPRPEVFTLLYLAAFLAVFYRAPGRPALLWTLPVLQVLWVNTHSLFILGPVVMAFYVIDKAIESILLR